MINAPDYSAFIKRLDYFMAHGPFVAYCVTPGSPGKAIRLSFL
jgi:hypothetical protein